MPAEHETGELLAALEDMALHRFKRWMDGRTFPEVMPLVALLIHRRWLQRFSVDFDDGAVGGRDANFRWHATISRSGMRALRRFRRERAASKGGAA